MNQHEYITRHFGLASFLRYVLSDAAHLATLAEEQSTKFVFTDEPRGHCRELADKFFNQEGAAVANARELLECGRALRQTINQAKDHPEGIWMADQTS